MKKILVFAGSNSKNSINKKLAEYAASLIGDVEVKSIDLNDFETQIYSVDRESTTGTPKEIDAFQDQLNWADAFVISVAEHNASIAVCFKNIMDWVTRHPGEGFDSKPVMLLSTTPGKGGAKSAREFAKKILGYAKANVVSGMVFPSFTENLKEDIQDVNLKKQMLQELAIFQKEFEA